MSKAITVDISGNANEVWKAYPNEFLYTVGRTLRSHTVKGGAAISQKHTALKTLVERRNKRTKTRWTKSGAKGDNIDTDMTSAHYKRNRNFWGIRFNDNRAMFLANRLGIDTLKDYRSFASGDNVINELKENLEKKYEELIREN